MNNTDVEIARSKVKTAQMEWDKALGARAESPGADVFVKTEERCRASYLAALMAYTSAKLDVRVEAALAPKPEPEATTDG